MTPIENYFSTTPSYFKAAEKLRCFNSKEYQAEVLLRLPLNILANQKLAEIVSQFFVAKKIRLLTLAVLEEIKKNRQLEE